MTEEWRPVTGYKGLYSVSSLGRIRTEGSGRGRTAGRVLKASPALNGYRVVSLWRSNKSRTEYVHRIVCREFNGPPPTGKDSVLHSDGDCLNNLPENLRWGTAAENSEDTARHGRVNNGQGSKTRCAQGHPYDDQNTYRYRGNRSCKTCMRQRTREWRERHKKGKNERD